MGTIVRVIDTEARPEISGVQLIPYSRYLVTNSLDAPDYVNNPNSPIWQYKYTYQDQNIEGPTPDNVGTQLASGYQIVFNAWDIDAVGGVRVGDRLQVDSLAGFVESTIIDVQQTDTQLTLLIDIQGITDTNDIDEITLYPVGRGNFGPVQIEFDEDQDFFYQPPTTYSVGGQNYFIIDASEAMKAYFQQFFNVTAVPSQMVITVFLDGSIADTETTFSAHDALVPAGATLSDETLIPISQRKDGYYQTAIDPDTINSEVLQVAFQFPDQTVYINSYLIGLDEIGEIKITQPYEQEPEAHLTCAQYEALTLDKNWVGLVWLNPFGAYDVWFFKYGTQKGPQHTYLGGDSQMQRVGWNVTQTNRGLLKRSWDLGTGTIPKDWVSFFAGLKESTRVYLIPNGTTLNLVNGPVSMTNIFSLDGQTGLVQVYVTDDDWADNNLVDNLTSYNLTVIESTLAKTRQM